MKPSQGTMFKRVRASFEDRERRQLAQRRRDIARHLTQGCYIVNGVCAFRFCPLKPQGTK